MYIGKPLFLGGNRTKVLQEVCFCFVFFIIGTFTSGLWPKVTNTLIRMPLIVTAFLATLYLDFLHFGEVWIQTKLQLPPILDLLGTVLYKFNQFFSNSFSCLVAGNQYSWSHTLESIPYWKMFWRFVTVYRSPQLR